MANERLKRVFAGFYVRYDSVNIRVLIVVNDVDTGEKVVIFAYEGKHNDGKNHCMSLRSFCEQVEFNGKLVPKFKRNTSRAKEEYYDCYLQGLGFEKSRKHIKNETTSFIRGDFRSCRQNDSYIGYAKDICMHYQFDLNRYNQTIHRKRWVGVLGQQEFDALKEDLMFTNDAFSTELKEYLPLFKARFIKQLSIRHTAEELGVNRGSVEYSLKKLYGEFASLLKVRDERDNISRLNQTFEC